MEKTWPHLTHEACIITAKPECMVSPSRVHFPPHSALCAVSIPMESQSWSMFTLRQPLSGLQAVCVVVAACVVVGLLFSLFSLAELALAIAAFTLLLWRVLYLVFRLLLICCVKQCNNYYKTN